jgi:polar amino acid transport system substrate-binding protein
MFSPGFRSLLGLLAGITTVLVCGEAVAQQRTVDRIQRLGAITVCADPDRLPYSSSKLDPPGFDIEFAQEIAKELGVRLEYNWIVTFRGPRALRELTTFGNCDFFLGLPHEETFEEQNFRLIMTKAYYFGGFATLVRSNAPETALADSKTKGVGVQMGTVPDFKLFDKGYERKLYKNTEEIYDALMNSEIDAAVAAMPEAAWLAKSQSDGKLKVLANTEREFIFPMGIGVRKADKDLRDLLNGAIDKIEADGRAQKILEKYGMIRLTAQDGSVVPTGAPKDDDDVDGRGPPPDKKSDAFNVEPKKVAAGLSWFNFVGTAYADSSIGTDGELVEPAVPSTDPAFPNDKHTLEKGRKLYKQACYKCHGPNVVSGGTLPDLRLFKGDNYEMFAVIQAGRPERGMPRWNEYLTEEEIKQITVYIKDVTAKTLHELLEHTNKKQ